MSKACSFVRMYNSNLTCEKNLCFHLLKCAPFDSKARRWGVCRVKSFLSTPMLQFPSWPCILLQLCEGKQEVIALPCLPQTDRKNVLTQR